ncbi:MAG: type II toxin-antitoxin system RelE/ParE family toxin [Mucilaginibacter sp.]|jgi:plasmid stabilization system protein ParE
MAKRIVYSRKAFSDIDRIVEFNDRRNQSGKYSKKFLKNLKIHLELLSRNSFIGLVTDESEVLISIWDNYYIFYVNKDEEIEIRSIYHQKENVR